MDLDSLGPEGLNGRSLESCKSLDWVGANRIDEGFINALFTRIRAAAYREPELLSLFGLSRGAVIRLLAEARDVFAREKTLEFVEVPQLGQVHILGDLHGDLFSFFSALQVTGMPDEENIIVIAGDLVDRGPWGTEILILVMVLKLWKPKSVFVIRGNHETSGCVTRYGFEAEVIRKYDLKTHRAFMLTLRELPLAIIVQSNVPSGSQQSETTASSAAHGEKVGRPPRRSLAHRIGRGSSSKIEVKCEDWEKDPLPGTRRILVCHGGLWRKTGGRDKSELTIGSLKDLASEHRQIDDPSESIAEDVLWSDPGCSELHGVRHNTLRGAGILYGSGAVDAFFKRERICGLIRGHEGPDMRELRKEMNSMSQGFSVDMDLASGFVATVFSAADYPMDAGTGNKGSVATINGRAKADGSAILPMFTTYGSSRPVPVCMFYTKASETDCPMTPRIY